MTQIKTPAIFFKPAIWCKRQRLRFNTGNLSFCIETICYLAIKKILTLRVWTIFTLYLWAAITIDALQ